ncbi:MAG TPA: hypothetical protein DCW44_00410 [Eubacterium sp.]|nr:hypothetical protein [Eubacterium sp.]
MKNYIHYKNEETGYEGYLYGESSLVIKNEKIGYYMHTGSRSINTFEELKKQVDEAPKFFETILQDEEC